MKRIITSAIILIIAMSALVGHNNVEAKIKGRDHRSHSSAAVVEANDNPVVFVKVSQNLTDNSCVVTPITNDGKCHSIVMASDNCSLKDICSSEFTDGEQIYTENEINEMISLYNRIDTFACETYNSASISEITSIYAVNIDSDGTPEFILLGTIGATVNIPEDSNAYQLCNYIGVSWS